MTNLLTPADPEFSHNPLAGIRSLDVGHTALEGVITTDAEAKAAREVVREPLEPGQPYGNRHQDALHARIMGSLPADFPTHPMDTWVHPHRY